MSNRRIIIMGNMGRPDVKEQIAALDTWFAGRAEVAWVGSTKDRPPDLTDVHLCVVFGGDGTLLAAARALAGSSVPLLGVNMGKLGFLAEFNVEHFQRHFEDILAGRVEPTERMMLQVQVESRRGKGFTSPAANDVAICAGQPFRMIQLNLIEADRAIVHYHGDGLIVSTPTGSTAYNMSAGGPIMEPTLQAIVITPIAPHSLTLRSIAIRPDRQIKILAERVNTGSAVIIDGQINTGLYEGDAVCIRRAERDVKIIPHPGRTFFGTLTSKLHWGTSPHQNIQPRQ